MPRWAADAVRTSTIDSTTLSKWSQAELFRQRNRLCSSRFRPVGQTTKIRVQFRILLECNYVHFMRKRNPSRLRNSVPTEFVINSSSFVMHSDIAYLSFETWKKKTHTPNCHEHPSIVGVSLSLNWSRMPFSLWSQYCAHLFYPLESMLLLCRLCLRLWLVYCSKRNVWFIIITE